MSLAKQVAALVHQRDQLADRVVELGGTLPESPTFKEINDELMALAPKLNPAYAAVYGGSTLVMGRGLTAPETYNDLSLTESWTANDGVNIEQDSYYYSVDADSEEENSDVPWWTDYRSAITSAVVVDEITPKYTVAWFNGLGNLATADLRLLNTSNTLQMNIMFQSCSSLTSVSGMSGWDTGSCEDMRSMFRNCSALTSVGDLSGWDTGSCTNMQSMFYNCSGLTSVGSLGSWDVSKVGSMSTVFYNCSSLASFGDLSGWQTGSCTDMYYMFAGCSKLASIGDLSRWDIADVTRLSYMFSDCSSLASVGSLDSWNVSNVKTMTNMFKGCSNLKSLDLSNWNLGSCENLSSMFYGCTALASVGNLSNWDTSKVASLYCTFYKTSALQSLSLTNWVTTSCTDFRYMVNSSGIRFLDILGFDTRHSPQLAAWLSSANYLQEIRVGDKVTFYGSGTYFPYPYSDYISGATGWWYNESGLTYSQATVPSNTAGTYYASPNLVNAVYGIYSASDNTLYFVRSSAKPTAGAACSLIGNNTATAVYSTFIGENYLEYAMPWYVDGNYQNVRKVVVQDAFEPLQLDYWFKEMSNLTTVAGLDKIDTSSVKSMRSMFSGCSALTSISELSGWSTSSCTSMYAMFNKCSSLTSISGLSSWDVSGVENLSLMFSDCSSLTTLDLSSWNTIGAKDTSAMFQDCTALTSIGNLASWNTANVTDMSYMFRVCKNLVTTGNLASWNTANVTDMQRMFYNCSKLSLNLSGWNVAKVTSYDVFRDSAPYIIAPNFG